MGNFYTNIVLHGAPRPAVVGALRALRRNAFVSPALHENVVVYDSECDEQDQAVLGNLAESLSRALNVPAWAVLNHDDDILWYQLYLNGVRRDEYDSSPGYFDPDAEPSEPTGGDASVLSTAFGVASATDTIAAILRKSSFEDEGYTFALDRHKDLANELNVPFELVCLGFNYLSQGELPGELTPDQFVKVDAA